MDAAKTCAKLVVAAGLVWVFPGPQVAPLLFGPDAPFLRRGIDPLPTPLIEPLPAPLPGAAGWFQRAKPSCNAVEVATFLRHDPYPDGFEGAAHGAACLALAGRVDQAREILAGLPEDRRWQAAGVVFEAGHPAADAGDEVAAGPLMELVVEFWPNHYMALYHAGASRYQRGESSVARDYLVRFLAEYQQDDGWTRSARSMLAEVDGAG